MSKTYSNLYAQVVKEIEKRMQTTSSVGSTVTTSASSVSSITSAELAEIVTTISTDLAELIEPRIISGLDVTAGTPYPTDWITVTAGTATSKGSLWELTTGKALQIPFDSTNYIFYVIIEDNALSITTTHSNTQCEICKIVVPNPGTTSAVVDDKPSDGYDAYIISAKDIVYGEDQEFDDTSIEKLRDVIGDVLADNLIGNIRLSENLKITNTQGSLELDSSSVNIISTAGTTVARFDRNGTFFYNDDGVEIAKFSTDEARIGNILITKDSIQSGDYISEEKGFKIDDTGFAEFDNVRVRGRISSSIFEYDKISAVGGKVYVGNASVLALDISPTDTTITVEDTQDVGDVFSLDEVLTIKNGINQEWMIVTDVSNAPIYTVTRDIAGTFATKPSWSKGTAIVSTGIGGSGITETGYILLDAISQYSPFIDINIRSSSIYSDVTTKVRLGNLCGITDDLYGSLTGYGLYSDNAYLRGKLYAPDIRTAITGSRAEMNTCCFTIYDSDGCQVFNIKYSGSESGDVTIGDLDTQYLCWNNTLDKLTLKSVNGNNCFELSDGNIVANSMTLQDPTCSCCYSYLNSGQWYFHDELNNSNPYVKRLCVGEAETGSTVVLCAWKSPPSIQVNIQKLLTYNSDYAVNCQLWCVYYDCLTCFCTSATCYGYCFNIHAELKRASGEYQECILDACEDTSIYTHSDAVCAIIKSNFNFWCYCDTSSCCYGYGIYCYYIKYRCNGGSAWTCCCYAYCQDYTSTASLKNCYYLCQVLNFPGACCWEIQQGTICSVWCLTNLTDASTCLCCHNIGAAYASGSVDRPEDYVRWCTAYALIDGAFVCNTYCSYICMCWYGSWFLCHRYGYSPQTWAELCIAVCDSTLLCCACLGGTSCCDAAGYSCWDVSAYNNYYLGCVKIITHAEIGNYWCNNYAGDWLCACASILYQCFYAFPDNSTNCYSRLYSLKDYTACQTILDPNGVLNYLAIGYN